MATNTKKLQEQVRNGYLAKIVQYLTENGEEVLATNSNEIAIPTLNAEGLEEWVVVKVSVPTGSRDGEAYDGYSMAEDYKIKVAEREEKARKVAEAKAKKIAKDAKLRAEKKAQRENKA